MNLIIQVSNNQVTKRLLDFGNLLYELKSLDAIVLEVDNKEKIEVIRKIPGVIHLEREAEGCLMV